MATIKGRLLPLLETSFSSVNVGKLTDNKAAITQVRMHKDVAAAQNWNFQVWKSEQTVFLRRPGTGDFHGQWNFLDSWNPERKHDAYQN